MQQLIVLKFGQGSWQSGFPAVTVQWIREAQAAESIPLVPTQWVGSLPAAPMIANLYTQWRSLHQALNQRLTLRRSAIEIEDDGITNVSPASLDQLSDQLKQALDRWLETEAFRKIDRRLRTHLTPADEIRVIIETEDPLLRRFPWHLWSFFEDYPLAEVALSVPEYGQVNRSRQSSGQVRILAVLGNSTGIDVQHDRALLEQLPQAEITFLVEPTRAELDRQLWATQGWNILFFAGHSSSQADGATGELAISPTENLTIAQLKNALKAAINRGLQIAIFNSCDGLGLARAMADLNIPQLVVMREPVPDRVAQTFLTHFLAAFANGQSFYPAVREARERLQGLETEFPCASWLPVICQNPAEHPLDWQTLIGSSQSLPTEIPTAKTRLSAARPISLKLAALNSLVVTGLVMGARWLGVLQSLELQAYDQLLRLRPAEVADPRILVVEVTQEDTNQYGYPLQDKTLATAIEKLAQMQPRTIGIDMHRYQPRGEGRSDLIRQFQQHPNLLTVCWFGSTDKNFAPPPEFSDAQRLSQVGFSDLLLDGNAASSTADPAGGIVRRQMLSYDPKVANSPPECATPYSFSFQLAFQFLYAAGVKPLEVNANNEWQFGPIAFRKLPDRFVAYQDLDGLSNQVMINYRQALPGQRVTLNQVLQGQVSRNFVENRIVLMGTTAPIARDSFITPLGELPGIWVHAHQISQILSAVQNQRPLIWGLPQWADALWVWLWAGIGAGLTWRWQSKRWWWLAIGLVLVVLYQISALLLVQGGWLAIVPAGLALLITSGILKVWRQR